MKLSIFARSWSERGALLLGLGSLLVSARASADTTLSVDLATTIRPVTHAASGSLYGVTEKLPADVNGLIGPLRPYVVNNPAADVQQPVGDAIVVAGRLAPIGTKVTIRLADLFPGWPYKFTTMNDWLDKVTQTVSRKKASGVDNYYGYEIWNEPAGTWTSSTPFNDFWKQTFVKLRALDPEAKIIGPSLSWFDSNNLKSFLTYAKANACLPDIVSWHELSGGNLTANFQAYRALEQQLGIGPLPISINEYSGKDDLPVEGQPGASAPMIAKFERFKVDSACISFWDVPHPGRLGSLLATDSTRNGGWWFYKWYGDMSGNMVATTPPSPNDATALDGFANVDATQKTASVVLGGVNDGTIRVVVKGFAAASLSGSKVHVLVEHTPFVNRTTAVTAADTVSSSDVAVVDDQLTVTIAKTNGTDGYRVGLSALDGGSPAGSGGRAGNGGSGATGGSSLGENGGTGGSGTGAGQLAGAGGTLSSGGTPSGTAAGSSSGGASAAAGGTTAIAGSQSSGGSAAGSASSTDAGCSCTAVGHRSTPFAVRNWAWLTLALILRRTRLARRLTAARASLAR